MRNTILTASTLGPAACAAVRPAEDPAVLPPTALGVFRYVCLDESPTEAPLGASAAQDEKVAGQFGEVDMGFTVSDQTCTMTVRLKEPAVDRIAGNRGNRSATEIVLEGLAETSPRIRTQVREDDYVVATIPKN